MDPIILSTALAPVLAGALSIVTLVITNKRAQRTEDRSAAKDTVDILKIQNELLNQEIVSLRKNQAELEYSHEQCRKQIVILRAELAALKSDHAQTD